MAGAPGAQGAQEELQRWPPTKYRQPQNMTPLGNRFEIFHNYKGQNEKCL